MAVTGVTAQGWILALFIRGDGQRFLLGSGAYDFKDGLQHFTANEFVNDTVDVQGGDGRYITGQVRRSKDQEFIGYIGDATCTQPEIETYRRQFLAFFQKNYYYEVVYVFPDETAIRRQRGYITKAPEVKEMWQVFPEYSVSLNFEDVNYYAYAEDENGNEIYTQSAIIPLYGSVGGGLVWDNIGAEFDEIGAVFDGGPNGAATLNINSISPIYPVWTVRGRSEYPVLKNITTSTSIAYDGIVTSSQTLVIDMQRRTATLNGVNVLNRISGEWVSFNPGVNRIRYDAQNDYAPHSSIEWSEVIA